MAIPKGFKVTKKEVSQKFNMKTLTKGKIKPKVYRDNKDEIMDRFIDEAVVEIENRNFIDGKDINGSEFTEYSKDYAKKKGVSRSDVTMRLKGKMFKSMREGDTGQTNTLKLQVGNGDVNTLKAYNHQVGDTLPQREWFGLNQDEIDKIIDDIAEDYE